MERKLPLAMWNNTYMDEIHGTIFLGEIFLGTYWGKEDLGKVTVVTSTKPGVFQKTDTEEGARLIILNQIPKSCRGEVTYKDT